MWQKIPLVNLFFCVLLVSCDKKIGWLHSGRKYFKKNKFYTSATPFLPLLNGARIMFLAELWTFVCNSFYILPRLPVKK